MKLLKIFKLSIIFAILAVSMSSCYTRIDSANTGLKVSKFGDDKGNINVLPIRGGIWYNPFMTEIYEYPNFVQRVDYAPFDVNTKDGSIIKVDVAMSYRILTNKVGDIFKKYRKPVKEIEQGYIATAVYDSYRLTANTFTVDELMGNRLKFDNELQEKLSKSLNNEGFYLEQITGKIDPPESLKNSIDSKNKAIQVALQAQNQVKEAEARAKIKIAEAEGEASAIKIKADAEAYANSRIANSITSNLVELKKVENWDGKLPIVSGGSNLVNLKDLK